MVGEQKNASGGGPRKKLGPGGGPEKIWGQQGALKSNSKNYKVPTASKQNLLSEELGGGGNCPKIMVPNKMEFVNYIF